MVVEKNTFGNPLEQFVLLAKSAKGAACSELIKQVLETPGIFVFGELLDMPNIQELADTPYKAYLNSLNLFAYGTYKQYMENKADYLELTPAQKKKLQHLTIVTLATKSKCIPYELLLKELDINNVRDLEDLIIEAVYADIIHGKLDHRNSQLEVDYALGRDIQVGDLDATVDCLQEWCRACEGLLSCVETQMSRANSERTRAVARKAAIDTEVVNIRKTLKAQLAERGAEAGEEVQGADSREAAGEKGKKSGKNKGSRSGSGKFWMKS